MFLFRGASLHTFSLRRLRAIFATVLMTGMTGVGVCAATAADPSQTAPPPAGPTAAEPGAGASGAAAQNAGEDRLLQLRSLDVEDGGRLAKACTCDGAARPPSLTWKNPPEGTRSFALIMDHTPRPGDIHVYWVLANVPEHVRLVDAEHPAGVTGANSMNPRREYAPPCSKGPGIKWYNITLYALDQTLDLKESSPLTREKLLKMMVGHTLGSSLLRVSYERDAQPVKPPHADNPDAPAGFER